MIKNYSVFNLTDVFCWDRSDIFEKKQQSGDNAFYFEMINMTIPACPKCQSEYTYADGELLICPECSYEWKEGEVATKQAEQVVDAHGQVLQDGDSVTVIKDLKVKGSSLVVKVGTKVKGIRLLADASDGHNIDCKINGIGAMKLKSEFVKKA